MDKAKYMVRYLTVISKMGPNLCKMCVLDYLLWLGLFVRLGVMYGMEWKMMFLSIVCSRFSNKLYGKG